MLNRTILIVLMILAPYLSYAASFDCLEASTRIEKLICSNDELSTADERLSQALKAALASSSDKKRLKREQSQWRKSRNSSTDVASLLAIYNSRIQELEALGSPNPIPETGNAIASHVTENSTARNSAPVIAVIAGMVLLNLFLCLVLHSKGKLTIYRDYTDAALTFAGLLIPIIALVATKCAELGDSLSYSITAACALIPLLFIFRSTYVHNSNLVYVLMSLMAKLTAIALYVVFLIGNSGSVKRDGGSDISNQNNRSAIAMIIYTALFMLLTRAMTRMRYFAPLHEHVSLSFARIPHDLIVVSDESF